jgi:uncharacterized membrane protein YhaH (DUF805 family)
MNWYLGVLKQYATFEGRARRKEYWFYALFYLLFLLGLAMVDGLTGTYDADVGLGLLSGLYILATIIPSVAVMVRRLHDTNRTGWWVLIGLVPLLGDIVLLVFACLDSQPGGNRFGPNPKGVIGPGTPSPVMARDLDR